MMSVNKSRNYRRDAASSGQVFHRLSNLPGGPPPVTGFTGSRSLHQDRLHYLHLP